MAKGKHQSPSSQRWWSGVGKAKKDARVRRSSHGKFSSVAELEAHREKVSIKGAKPKLSLKD